MDGHSEQRTGREQTILSDCPNLILDYIITLIAMHDDVGIYPTGLHLPRTPLN